MASVTCGTCGRLGSLHFANYTNEGEELPPEAFKLPIVSDWHLEATVRRCTECGSYFLHTWRYDSDFYYPTDRAELKRVDAAEAERIIAGRIAQDRASRREFRAQLRKRHGAAWRTLAADEMKVVDHLMKRLHNGELQDVLAKELGCSAEALDRLLSRLEQKKIVSRLRTHGTAPRVLFVL